MNYLECKNMLQNIVTDAIKIENIKNEIGTGIDELFIASSDFTEMNQDLKLLFHNNFELPLELLTSNNKDFCLWLLTDNGFYFQLPEINNSKFKSHINVNEKFK